jgi:hypothetical protein
LSHSPSHAEAGNGHRHAHEYSDATVHSVALLAGAFVVLLAFGFVVAYIAFRVLNAGATVGPPASPISSMRELPPGPRLQVNGHAELEEYLKQQQQTLESYGWVDRSGGIVHIPIDRAMQVLVQQGLPVRTPEAPGHMEASRSKGAGVTAEARPRSAGGATVSSRGER